MTDREILHTCPLFHINKSPSPNTPRLSMEVEPTIPVMSLAKPGGFIITIRRAEDDCDKPCIFRWNFLCDGWGPSGFVLFQHTPDGLKRVEIVPKPPPP
ncbi:uncharacterized protein N7529_001798 [Penicillium soppii]|jgi:hypothetical protein|uniref:uncharacterized protein n=1 Tax=Penicillium soppii TaxID=69789 RepID=UPI0025475338|nr:uncharacterized protein N7529_001798 [Penicillium soppii]KAJ5876214.1 hypothetical protein N7529_001798 [Penicillium soppii]